MDKKELLKIDEETIIKSSVDFLINNRSNPFYDKNVFFTKGLCSDKYIAFQIIGNLGGCANDTELNAETDYLVIADSIINQLKLGKIDEQLIQLEDKLNRKGKKREKIKIISESVFLEYSRERSEQFNDDVTLELISRLQ
jgi:hypothetical protein